MSAKRCTVAAVLGLALCATPAAAREEVYYFHNDHLGTPQAMSDAAGRTVWQAEYEPFGKAVVNDDPDGDGQHVTNNLRLPGQYYDAETGLHYNYHRDYDPATGRYLQPDPIGLEGGTNLYAYVSDNPINLVDPLGLLVEVCTRSMEDLPFDHAFILLNGADYGFFSKHYKPFDEGEVRGPGHETDFTNCKEQLCINEDALLQAILRSKGSPPRYNVAFFNCNHWKDLMLSLAGTGDCCSGGW